MIKIPKKLKINGNIINVVRGLRGEHGGEDQDGGWSDWEGNEIFVATDMSQTRQEAVLLHEIIHQINVYIPEREAMALSESLYQVLRDNKLLK